MGFSAVAGKMKKNEWSHAVWHGVGGMMSEQIDELLTIEKGQVVVVDY